MVTSSQATLIVYYFGLLCLILGKIDEDDWTNNYKTYYLIMCTCCFKDGSMSSCCSKKQRKIFVFFIFPLMCLIYSIFVYVYDTTVLKHIAFGLFLLVSLMTILNIFGEKMSNQETIKRIVMFNYKRKNYMLRPYGTNWIFWLTGEDNIYEKEKDYNDVQEDQILKILW